MLFFSEGQLEKHQCCLYIICSKSFVLDFVQKTGRSGSPTIYFQHHKHINFINILSQSIFLSLKISSPTGVFFSHLQHIFSTYVSTTNFPPHNRFCCSPHNGFVVPTWMEILVTSAASKATAAELRGRPSSSSV